MCSAPAGLHRTLRRCAAFPTLHNEALCKTTCRHSAQRSNRPPVFINTSRPLYTQYKTRPTRLATLQPYPPKKEKDRSNQPRSRRFLYDLLTLIADLMPRLAHNLLFLKCRKTRRSRKCHKKIAVLKSSYKKLGKTAIFPPVKMVNVLLWDFIGWLFAPEGKG